jgi:glycosyltransferase involved in cell wall biosynthesis
MAGIESRVLFLLGENEWKVQLREAGINCLGTERGRLTAFAFLPQAVRQLTHSWRPDVLHGWMYHGNLAAACARAMFPDASMVWAVRNSLESPEHIRWSTRIAIRANALLERRVDITVFNSKRAMATHEPWGFRGQRRVVIPNGFELPAELTPEARARIRSELNIAPEEFVIGMVARFDPAKNHELFLRALHKIDRPGLVAAVVGPGASDENSEWRALLERLRPLRHGRLLSLGVRSDLPELWGAFDVGALTSAYEGFPNAVGEGMGMGVPFVVTDAGDCREIVADTGAVVNIGDADGLARALDRFLLMSASERQALGARARERIRREYGMAQVLERYQRLYRELFQRRFSEGG